MAKTTILTESSTRGRGSLLALLLLGAGPAVGGCGPAPDDEGPTSERRSAIDVGKLDTGDPWVGMVYVNNQFQCTGTLIAPQTVLTAKHCLTEAGMTFVQAATGAFPIPAEPFGHYGSSDEALLHLDIPSAGVTPYQWFGPIPAIGTNCTVVGYGKHLESDGSFSVGTKRSATVKISSNVSGGYVKAMQATGITDHGDSGGPMVCGGTIVATATSVNDNGGAIPYPGYNWGTWSAVDVSWMSDFNGPIAIPVAMNGNQLKVFAIIGDGIYHDDWDGTRWTGFQTLSFTTVGLPGAVSWGPDRMDVFARGTDNGIYQQAWTADAGGFGPSWWPLGGSAAGDPVAVSTGMYRLDVIFPDNNNGITDILFDGNGWVTTSIPSSGGANDRVSAVVSQGIVHVFWRTPNNQLRHAMRMNPDGPWTTPEPLALGTSIGGSPSAVAFGTNQMTVFARALDGRLLTVEWNGTMWSGALFRFNGTFAGSPAAVAWSTNRINVFVLGDDSGLWNVWFDGTNWHGFDQLNANPLSGSPSVVSWGTNRLGVYARGPHGEMERESWDGSSWSGYSRLGTSTQYF